MSRICQITGKQVVFGNNVSHSNHKTRLFKPNLCDKKFYLTEEKKWVNLRVSAHGIRIINKIGLKNALDRAKEKNYIKSY